MDPTKIALALGSGGARGWAHIGIIEALQENGIQPKIVCGSSVGSMVGGAYACGQLPALRSWAEALKWKDIVALMDVSFSRGGLIEGERVIKHLQDRFSDHQIEDLAIQYIAVATELDTGREVWIRTGSLLKAMRTSFAQPGLFSPVQRGDKWLADGGLVNPVPVSACRALGAEFIIAVNLNNKIAGKRKIRQQRSLQARRIALKNLAREWLPGPLTTSAESLIERTFNNTESDPGYTDVIIDSINIMQDRITKSRMAGDPPDIVLNPRLSHLGVLDYDSASDSIEEGRKAVTRMLPAIKDLLSRP